MGYEIRAFIARAGTFTATQALSRCITVAPLNQGFELLYKDDLLEDALEAVNKLPEDGFAEPFQHSLLSATSFDWAVRTSHQHPIAYVMADFFGGTGLQSAVIWKDGQIALLPTTNGLYNYDYRDRGLSWKINAPINSALRFLGVQIETASDEFEAIGLMQCREREDWVYKFNHGYGDGGCKSIYDMDYEG